MTTSFFHTEQTEICLSSVLQHFDFHGQTIYLGADADFDIMTLDD